MINHVKLFNEMFFTGLIKIVWEVNIFLFNIFENFFIYVVNISILLIFIYFTWLTQIY